jgi:hypothetical protein
MVMCQSSGDEISVFGVLASNATRVSAQRKNAGNFPPCFAARRRTPAHAVGLEKYRSGIEPVSSTETNETHAAPSLGQADVLSVENAICEGSDGSDNHTRVRPPPALKATTERFGLAHHSSKEASESVILCTEDAGHVLPNNDCWVDCMHYLHEGQGQVPARVVERFALARDAEGLARRPAGEDVYPVGERCGSRDGVEQRFIRPSPLRQPAQVAERMGQMRGDSPEVAEIRHVGEVMRQYGGREGFNLGREYRLPAERFPRDGVTADTAAY